MVIPMLIAYPTTGAVFLLEITFTMKIRSPKNIDDAYSKIFTEYQFQVAM